MTVMQLAKAPAGWVTRSRDRAGARAKAHAADGVRRTTSAALLLGTTGALLTGGLIMILSSSWVSSYRQYHSSYYFFHRQLFGAGIGVVVMLIASRIDYRKLRGVGYVLLGGSIAGLVAVLVSPAAKTVGGSSRWLTVGGIGIQPSELAKLALVLVAADLCTRKGARLRTFKEIMIPLGLVGGVVGLLVLRQPDLGTAIILTGIVFAALFVAGARVRVLAGMGLAAGAGAILKAMTQGYQRARLMSFFNPFASALDTGYQSVQAQIALGSGGLFGVGLGASRQKWAYVPNAHTDFIFAIIGEELGLLGTFVVIALIALLGYAGVRVARRAPDTFGRILAGGITAWIVGQAVVNMGAVTGILPITGVPLPLVSFGGSSLVFTLAGLGILTSIARREQWPPPARADHPARAGSEA